ncbi:MAG: carboxypeptidase regulatory-like domain-containing protein [Flavobacterium sp.]|uniref:OmpA family protein n=1 Tax=Flavobacterium sp. TaxID=239 RepID=UPI00378F181D
MLILSFSFSYAQKAKLASADRKYDQYAYIDAIEIYKKVAEKGHKSADLFKKLGNSYYFNSELKEANKWYSELFALGEEIESEYYFRYAHTLKAIGDYKKADEYLDKFAKKASTENRAQIIEKNKDYLTEIKMNSGRYKIETAGINSEFSDYGSSFYKDEFVFATARDSGGSAVVSHKWTNKKFLNLYSAKVNAEGMLTDPKPFEKMINSKYNESTATFTKDGKTMYFTRNNYADGKIKANSNKVTLLKLYKATFEGGKWGKVTELPFNSNDYSCAHPALSVDDKTLYFASDMPGSIGQSDIFKVAISDDGTFGTPENMGKEINTESRESFPFVSDKNELFFASDGHLGLGGLDIFSVKFNSDGTNTGVFNLGAPINSSFDDFAYIIDSESKNGFFSSNRDGGLGSDDIYKFKEIIPLKYNMVETIEGTIVEEDTKEIVSDAKITLLDEQMNPIETVYTDAKGNYKINNLKTDKNYRVRVERKDYETVEEPFVTGSGMSNDISNIKIGKKVKKVTLGSDLAKTFGIQNVYFDLDDDSINSQAELELEKILQVLIDNPTMCLEVQSHTDSRQTHEYNQRLSDRRVKSTIKWLKMNGIAPNRLSGKGFGETQLANHCEDGVECSEAEHSANRRSQFIITKM